MTTRNSPWDEIKTPKSDYSVRDVEQKSVVPLYWGKDTEGRCLFVIELKGDHAPYFRKNRITIHGIKLDLRQLEIVGSQGLVLSLEAHVDRDLFCGLCKTLIAVVKDIEDPAAALAVALTHIKRWKAFMAGRKKQLLSAEEVRGLFAELKFFQEMLQCGVSEQDVVESWMGPERGHQDFVYRNTAVEVKAISGRDRNAVRISSEDQLESLLDNLYLRISRIVELADSEQALSLNQLVRQLEEKLVDGAARESFSAKLAAAGYVWLLEYDQPKFIVQNTVTYRVEEGFPRIIRSELQDGVLKVQYDIELHKLEPFIASEKIDWKA